MQCGSLGLSRLSWIIQGVPIHHMAHKRKAGEWASKLPHGKDTAQPATEDGGRSCEPRHTAAPGSWEQLSVYSQQENRDFNPQIVRMWRLSMAHKSKEMKSAL